MRSLVEYFAEHESYRCGYCKSVDTNYSHGLWAHALTVSDYQDLIDRGWRRSGKYCYKPTMDLTCCPMYTIRCRSQEFKATKSQKKILKRVNKFLTGQYNLATPDAGRKMSTCSSNSEAPREDFEEGGGEQFVESIREQQDINLDNFRNDESLDMAGEENNVAAKCASQRNSEQENSEPKVLQRTFKLVAGPDPNKAQCKKAKQLRRERKLEKLREKGIDLIPMNNVNKNKEKQIEDYINDLPDDVKHKLVVRLVRTSPPSPEWLNTSKETHKVYVKYQTVIHNERPDKCTEPKFKEFLVQSPLQEEYSENGPPCGYGSFHQQYWLDDKLIAVGVIDILPKCVSSVYFFYDPYYMNLTLGTYGALREIEFTRYMNTLCPEIKYYYLGFYIHSCPKMRYKGNFSPSDLLCPETYKWFPIEDCIPKLETTPYSRLNPDIDSIDENCPNRNVINYIPVWSNSVVMLYSTYKKQVQGDGNDKDNKDLMEYAHLVGAKTAKSLILVR